MKLSCDYNQMKSVVKREVAGKRGSQREIPIYFIQERYLSFKVPSYNQYSRHIIY